MMGKLRAHCIRRCWQGIDWMNTISIEWDDAEHTVVRLTLQEGFTWSELYVRNQEIVDMMESTDEPVHLLAECVFRTVPLGGVITHARNILGAYPPNCDMRVIMSSSVLVQRLVRIFQVTFRTGLGKNVYPATSMEDAYDAIRLHARARAR